MKIVEKRNFALNKAIQGQNNQNRKILCFRIEAKGYEMLKKTAAVIFFPIIFSFACMAAGEDYILIDSGSCPAGYVNSAEEVKSVCDSCSCPSGYVVFNKTTISSDSIGSFTYTCDKT